MAIALAVNLAVRLPDGPGQPAGIQYQREPFVSGKGRWGVVAVAACSERGYPRRHKQGIPSKRWR